MSGTASAQLVKETAAADATAAFQHTGRSPALMVLITSELLLWAVAWPGPER